MRLNVHFFTRLAAREAKAARKAMTDAAKERHLAMADHYMKRADELRQPVE